MLFLQNLLVSGRYLAKYNSGGFLYIFPMRRKKPKNCSNACKATFFKFCKAKSVLKN